MGSGIRLLEFASGLCHSLAVWTQARPLISLCLLCKIRMKIGGNVVRIHETMHIGRLPLYGTNTTILDELFLRGRKRHRFVLRYKIGPGDIQASPTPRMLSAFFLSPPLRRLRGRHSWRHPGAQPSTSQHAQFDHSKRNL